MDLTVEDAAARGKEFPVATCHRRSLGPLTADETSIFWRGVEPVHLRENLTAEEPRQRTVVKLAWNADEFRLLFQAEDTHAWATLTTRDAPLYEEEVIEVFLDPVGDHECYFEFEVNPLNAVLDLVLRRSRAGYRRDFSWDCEALETRVRKHADRWIAELSIPFRSLIAQPPLAGAKWRANFCRIDRPPGIERELSAWAPTRLNTFHVPERFGTLIFTAD